MTAQTIEDCGDQDNDQWQEGAGREGESGGQGRLNGLRFGMFGQAQLVTGMRPQGIGRHKLRRHLVRQIILQATRHVDLFQFFMLGIGKILQLLPFARQIGIFCIRL